MSVTIPFDFDAVTAQKWKSPDFALSLRTSPHARRPIDKETILDPVEISTYERCRQTRLQEYFGSRKTTPSDPRDGLPILQEDTASTLASRYGASQERLLQGLALESLGLRGKARRLVVCGRLGHRIDHQKNRNACHRKYFNPYFCREKYCTFCGPQQFRELFAKLQNALSRVAETLVSEGSRKGRNTIIAKLDFTVPNHGRMPTREEVQKFHADLRRFWRAAEYKFGIRRNEYGIVRCDEIGGNNTNLHCHCAYVGPWLPQKNKELTHLWSKIRGERSFVSIKLAKNFSCAIAHALKYPAKFLDKSTPERLAALEKTFHRTRRVSTGGAFYNLRELGEPGDDRQFDHSHCPFCYVRLVQVREQWQPFSVLESEGRISLQIAERDAGLQKALGHETPP
jgi:hypothetical protein